MRFGRTPEQHAFSEALDDLLGAADVPSAARAWAGDDRSAGLKIWQRLAELSVTGLLVPESDGGVGADPVDLTVAFERLGYHGVPGPWIESVAVAPRLLGGTPEAGVLSRVASGEALVSVASGGRALDADVVEQTYALESRVGLDTPPPPPLVEPGERQRAGVETNTVASATLSRATVGSEQKSVDPSRRLFDVTAGDEVVTLDPRPALELGTLACAAMLHGAGLRLLDDSVAYVKQRTQFGRPIGEFQAVKHLLADVRVALDFAAPLIHNAALELDAEVPTAARAVSAAKVAAGDAAYLASRTALQVHGAIGYTREFDLSLWILRVRALVGAWGTPAEHRARILESLVVEPVETPSRGEI
ncbi:alkylation response protein AidB-like acyl-CoA dehydrogenase [Nocardioides luteus]|uniref:Acyl-CoA dehydrogenase n=1 Tax=Nocardioides luteus TaxID=1844 RepID=A0ABQ5SY33_9ACTN|nr:acyl-CoA dehydrogenase family protein [Nocardioides luteus]MDR7312834.1 alkylation response protein AidB-like acyl-CoA dehydrogenase [Nocardioides luteus]GGR47898.1 acyl-CoA dehydrogenase [Nocardioides luteus]GLJ69088.1 acyl-CoA dehydrogenase [Nocardioides luteus]